MHALTSLRTCLMAVLLALVASEPATGQGTPEDELAIRTALTAHANAWTAKDVAAAAAVYHHDASVRLASGREYQGRAGVEAWHRAALASPAYARSVHSHPPESVVIRFIRPDLAIVDVESVFEDLIGSDGTTVPPARGVLVVVFTKESGEWLVLAQRPGAAPPAR